MISKKQQQAIIGVLFILIGVIGLISAFWQFKLMTVLTSLLCLVIGAHSVYRFVTTKK